MTDEVGSSIKKVSLQVGSELQNLFGPADEHRKLIEEALQVKLMARDGALTITGPEEKVTTAERVITQLLSILERGEAITAQEVRLTLRLFVEKQEEEFHKLQSDFIEVSPKKRPVRPKSPGQRRYIEAIRKYDIVLGIGPAGTGKTYLAMAMAVNALLKRQVSRIILTRPAVEAGEKLGYLPGTLYEKINPYLRPLYDALYDMIEADRANRLIEQGTIEIAPLAFMRGRAQPVHSKVLTPLGWREIGSLEVGDWVIGSNGRPTQVLGIFPQGRKEVFRVILTDGASTLACAEHLWAVYTPWGKRRKRPPRVLETREVMGRLRIAHQHRYELPLLSAPVEFPLKDVPLDPYALGLLLGDGCLTGKATPTFATADAELAKALERSLEGIQLVRRSEVDYVLRHVHGGRGGTIVANPATETLRALGLWGTYSNAKFIPEVYLYNSAEVRLSVLQGLLDSDGGPVIQEGRTCRIQFTTSSSQLRDDVVFLVRSLGGVAYWRIRRTEDKKPGWIKGREVPHRSESWVLDIRLPEGIQPFRLSRKAEIYEKFGGGRPMRFIKAIEPAGVEETVCILVDAPDHLYVTDDFILTHNTLNDAFIILDEAQNTTSEQMKMFLTRLGFGSKAVITGDITQVDLPAGKLSGLIEVRQILKDIPGIKFVHLSEEDVVRHELVSAIIRAYEAYQQGSEQRRASGLRPPRTDTAGQPEDPGAEP